MKEAARMNEKLRAIIELKRRKKRKEESMKRIEELY